MDLSRVKQLMREGMSFETAYGFCMQQLARAETKYPITRFKKREGTMLRLELCVLAAALRTIQRLSRQ